MIRARIPWLILVGSAVIATGAEAQTAPPTPAPTPAIEAKVSFSPRAPVFPVLSYARRDAGRIVGFPATAVSRRLSPDGPVGSVGYLCGIKPFAPDDWGVRAGPASGFDRGLTFLGLKLDYAFK